MIDKIFVGLRPEAPKATRVTLRLYREPTLVRRARWRTEAKLPRL